MYRPRKPDSHANGMRKDSRKLERSKAGNGRKRKTNTGKGFGR